MLDSSNTQNVNYLGPKKKLILNEHIDVVPSGDESNWDNPPWRGVII